jgi:NAD+ kinase
VNGIIAATALGSTAYSFSAGASPCHPALRALQVTPICPHRPRLSPLTLPWGAVLDIDVLDPDRRPVRTVADGEDQGRVRSLRVGPDGRTVKLAFLEGHDFTRTLIAKVLKV